MVATINQPNGEPYLTIVDDESVVKIEMHAYSKQRAGKVFFVVDKRCLPELIEHLTEVMKREQR